MVVPVGIAAVEIDEHIVDEIVYVEQRRAVGRWFPLAVKPYEAEVVPPLVGQGVYKVCHLVPGFEVAIVGNGGMIVAGSPVYLRDIPVRGLAAKLLGAEIVRDTLAHVV